MNAEHAQIQDQSLLRRFASESEHTPGETLYEVMRFIGQDLLQFT